MKFNAFKIVFVLNIIALAILFAVWWVNGRDDTWFYATAALIVLSSFLYVRPPKNN